MATLTLTGDAGRIWKIGEALQRALGESPTQQSVSVTIDNSAMTVTLASGKVITT